MRMLTEEEARMLVTRVIVLASVVAILSCGGPAEDDHFNHDDCTATGSFRRTERSGEITTLVPIACGASGSLRGAKTFNVSFGRTSDRANVGFMVFQTRVGVGSHEIDTLEKNPSFPPRVEGNRVYAWTHAPVEGATTQKAFRVVDGTLEVTVLAATAATLDFKGRIAFRDFERDDAFASQAPQALEGDFELTFPGSAPASSSSGSSGSGGQCTESTCSALTEQCKSQPNAQAPCYCAAACIQKCLGNTQAAEAEREKARQLGATCPR